MAGYFSKIVNVIPKIGEKSDQLLTCFLVSGTCISFTVATFSSPSQLYDQGVLLDSVQNDIFLGLM